MVEAALLMLCFGEYAASGRAEKASARLNKKE
jgi:hypothetical protein